MNTGGVAHWDEVEPQRREVGHMAADWRNLGGAAGSVTVGVQRLQIVPGKWSTAAHAHGAAEEIFYVLGGSGLLWQDDDVYEIGDGDCIVHTAGGAAHTLRAASSGLDVLAFGMRPRTEYGDLPRAGVLRFGWPWVEIHESNAWEREAEAGEPEVGEPAPRPSNVVHLEEAPARFGGLSRPLGEAAGSEQTGLNLVILPPGGTGAPPHCHSADEEIFVVLAGAGALELTPAPVAAAQGAQPERHELRAGSIVARPAATRMAHAFRAGDGGMTYLAYGTREPNDMAYYPRSNKFFLRGLGLIGRVEPLDYADGEPED